jgi:hypothetical protein
LPGKKICVGPDIIHGCQQTVDLIPTRIVSEGLLSEKQQILSLTDLPGCENPSNQQPEALLNPGVLSLVIRPEPEEVPAGQADC